MVVKKNVPADCLFGFELHELCACDTEKLNFSTIYICSVCKQAGSSRFTSIPL